jgi:hypothetical protein
MTNYDVRAFVDFDDFETYVETLATTTDIQTLYSPEKGYIVIVG